MNVWASDPRGRRAEAQDSWDARAEAYFASLAHTPEGRQRIRCAVGRRIASGKIAKQPCEVCGSTQYVDAHHRDYTRPFDVVFLCRKHHKAEHAMEG